MSRDALIVGINIYRNLPNLQAPAEDAEAIAKLLNQYGEFDVMRRLPEAINQETQKPYVGKKIEVSFTELEDALVKLFKPEGQNIPDTALFYFSGHGIRKTKGIQEGFLATSDVNPSVGFNGLSLQWLRRLLAESPIKQQIIWLDCCHSGELLNFNEANPGDGGKARDRCFIAASREFEPAYEDLGGQYSVLTKVLREGLNPEISPQRLVTNISLTDYLNRHLQGAIQTSLFSNFGEPIKLTRSGEVGPDKPVTDNQICPYKGLQYFDYGNEDYKYFYGREKLTDELLDKIRETNFLAVLGASGSGKSSVIRAGLLHQLKQGRKLSGSSNWQIHILVPGEDPRQSFELSFIDPGLSNLDRALQLGKARELLEKGAEGLELLVQCSDAPRVVIFIDQFEEVFTLCQDLAERKQFFECLLGAVEKARGKLCIIIAMRADFLGKCLEQEYSGLARKIQENLVPVLPLNRKHLQEAIAFPARRVNLMVEEGLIQQMITEVEGAPGSLPLLEYTLTQLWENRTDNQLKLSTYAQLGGIGGTLNKRAREVYGQFSPEEQNIAKYIFLSLTQLGEETEDTRRRISRQDLITEKHPENLIEQVLQKLANERLIVTQEDNLKSTIIDVAHEALIRHWEDLRGWLDESRDALRKQREIERDAKIWQLHANNRDYLWLGFKLAEAEQVLQTYAAKVSLSNLAQEFIEACREQELSSYLRITDVDSLDRKGLEEEAAVKSFLTKDNLRQLLENDKKEEKIRLAASWLLKQWGEEVTMVMAEIDGQGKISLRIIKSPPTLVEELGNGITLELVEIPRGEFWMGSLEGEEGSNSSEYPRHKVRVSPFLMGKYPVTQAQWRAIASLTPVERELILQPSYFKGDNCPVESVSWYDAVEFCKRLSRATGRDYRLPSEAEWEYACRAVTSPLFKRSQGESNPPFHFGETISPDLANYSEADRARTTPVGRFQVANAFGLYDLHGLVWEFCEDNWHDNYEGAPTDGTAWLSEKTERIVLRGGSWDDSPNLCRSHFRNINITRINILNWIGFRVVCMLPKTY
jgi:formylglycine-generating enzyme required for sulfatase activity/energy-coupling factor transporter ATP-binding protein EcfA2